MKNEFVQRAFFTAVGVALVSLSANAHAQSIAVDGLLDSAYGSPLAVQTNNTQFGDNASDSSGTSSGGSELDAGYGNISNSSLNLFLSGNLQASYNHLTIFIANGSTSGESTLSTAGSPLNAMNGSVFSPGFKATYALDVNGGGTPTTFYVNKYDLLGGTSQYINSFLGGAGAPTTLLDGTNIAINNGNTLGVGGGVAAADPTAAAAVETGLEVSIPLANLGSPHGNIEVMAVITGGSNTYTSNQFLPGLPTVVDNVYNTTNPYNLNGTTNGFNLGSVANGFFTVVAPVASGINSVWLATGNGSWSTAGNWSAGIPNSAGDIANFNGSNTAAANVTLDGSHTVGQIVFNSLNTYNISQGTGGTLTINDTGDTAGVNPLITVNTGSHIISAPVSLFNGLTVNALNLTNLNVSGGVSGTGGITKIGGGNLALSGATTFTGGVTVLNGSVELDVNSAAAGNTITLGDPTADNVFTSLNIGQSGLNITLPVVTNYDDSESDNQRAIAAIYPTGSSTYSGTITVNGGIVLSAPVGTSLVMSGTIQNGTVVNGTKQKHDLTVNGQSGTNGGTVLLTVPETYTGLTIVNGGTLSVTPQATLASTGYYVNTGGLLSFAAQNSGGIYTRTLAGPLTINGGTVAVAGSTLTANRQLLVATGLSLSGTTGAWTGQLDLANNDLDIPNGNLAQMTDQVKQGFNATGTLWTGQGITSSSAAGNTSQLTALGVIANTADGTNPLYGSGTAAGLFDGANPAATDVLVKYTYYGDANLDGKVDASDYSRIDSNFATGGTLTGWYNGDFNYDGVVNGSDYTLIDNAFNRQGAHLTAELAASTAEIAGGISGSSSVPEPTTLGLMTIAIAGLLGRRKRAN